MWSSFFSNVFKLKISREIDVHCIKNKNVNSEDISDHCTLCTKSCIPADYMLNSPNSALEGAAFECKRMKYSPLNLPYFSKKSPKVAQKLAILSELNAKVRKKC